MQPIEGMNNPATKNEEEIMDIFFFQDRQHVSF